MGKLYNSNESNKKHNKLVNMFAAITEITLLIPISYPIDLIKSRMQTDYYKQGKISGNNYMHNKKPYANLLMSLKTWEHNKTLYRGFAPLYFGLVIKQPMKMVAFEAFASKTNENKNEKTNKIFYFHLSDSAKGSIAAAFSGLIVGIPLSYIKTNYQVNDVFKLNLSTIKKINVFDAWKYEVFKELIGNIAYFTLYGEMRKRNNILDKKYQGITDFLNGSVSGVIATFFAYPVDLLKTRKQTTQKNSTLKEIFISVGYENKKIKPINFWRGSAPTYFRVCLFGGIGMFVYEKMRGLFSNIIE